MGAAMHINFNNKLLSEIVGMGKQATSYELRASGGRY